MKHDNYSSDNDNTNYTEIKVAHHVYIILCRLKLLPIIGLKMMISYSTEDQSISTETTDNNSENCRRSCVSCVCGRCPSWSRMQWSLVISGFLLPSQFIIQSIIIGRWRPEITRLHIIRRWLSSFTFHITVTRRAWYNYIITIIVSVYIRMHAIIGMWYS